jgi:hypothetical protein
MTGFLLIRAETRVPSVVFAQDCPMDTACAGAAGTLIHTSKAHSAIPSRFTDPIVAIQLLKNHVKLVVFRSEN